ncbi:MAG: UDP-N-acetylglucosamine--N-acetylmuramyl-(pentapeptide) pyrophosphoryl-undecaprenol N-acetylglucosamine transferase [Treponema sp.]|nr:UDP-N-acetylglucosamine--N-acetylmuramyl-(pentapeptide) pyrophosphoryl-undecaprenol N-acetylglucosamine transferase [Treponema sp.]
MKLNNKLVCFTGGGTGGHIYPGLAVADELKTIAKKNNKELDIYWLGSSKGMDKKIIEKAIGPDGKTSADKFFGIPSGKLRRYFSFQNFSDLFRIMAGFFKSYHILRKYKPALLFSKGGFVSVPPCLAARFLKIPVYTHECDFTLGLANRINFKSAKTMFLSYEETKNRLSSADQKRVIVTGNPVRPVFYNTNPHKAYEFLGLKKEEIKKPLLLVLGGSSGARQINDLIFQNIDYLAKNFLVIHQTGLVNSNQNESEELQKKYPDSYKAYNFIYDPMPDLLSAADLVLSRAGANSIWEAAVLFKPMLLIPLCGSGTRGDQVDNAKYFEEKNAAKVLIGQDANGQNLKKELDDLLIAENRAKYSENLKNLISGQKPAYKIADIIYKNVEEN